MLREKSDKVIGPPSPYIFVLYMDKLSYLILSVVSIGEWKAVKASSQYAPKICHLFFANDHNFLLRPLVNKLLF